MIDWNKERTTKNYCGYCSVDTTISNSCDGYCFNKKENRVDHILTQLELIPLEIEALKKREQNYRDALDA